MRTFGYRFRLCVHREVTGLVIGLGVVCNIASQTSPAEAQSGNVKTDTTTRIAAWLDSRYHKSDVQHSFKTMFGETVDCVDYFAQPGVRALSARGITIQPQPTEAVDAQALNLTRVSPFSSLPS
jgi:hypothetical protein